MRISWQRGALDDVKSCVPKQFRKPLRDFLSGLYYVGQGAPSNDPRYPEARYIKFQYWIVVYVAISDRHIGVLAVYYDYGQPR
jgi:hypothetical protein